MRIGSKVRCTVDSTIAGTIIGWDQDDRSTGIAIVSTTQYGDCYIPLNDLRKV